MVYLVAWVNAKTHLLGLPPPPSTALDARSPPANSEQQEGREDAAGRALCVFQCLGFSVSDHSMSSLKGQSLY